MFIGQEGPDPELRLRNTGHEILHTLRQHRAALFVLALLQEEERMEEEDLQ